MDKGNRGTGSLTGVDSKLGRRTCEIAKRCAPSSVERPMLKSKGARRVFGSSHIFYTKYIGGIEYASFGRAHGALYLGYGYVPLRFGGNVVRRVGTQQQQRIRVLHLC